MKHGANHSLRVAVFDLGSNSLKFMAAETHCHNQFSVLKNDFAITRLGEGTVQTGLISEAAIARSISAIRKAKLDFENFQVDEWIAVATSAVRDAKNGSEFRKVLKEQLGLDLQILQGNEEAELIYYGVVSDDSFVKPSDSLLVIDSGGGSTELILGTSVKIEKRISLNLGCVRMTEQFLNGDPYSSSSLNELNKFCRKEAVKVAAEFKDPLRKVICTGGIISTVAGILKSKSKDSPPDTGHESLHGMILRRVECQDLFIELSQMKNSERIRKFSLEPKRADVMTAGLSIFLSMMDAFEIPSVVVSLRGLRHGVLMRRLAEK